MKTNYFNKAIRILLILLTWCLPSLANDNPEIEKVTFKGNHAYSADRLKSLMVNRPSGFLKPRHYHENLFHDDLNRLILYYQQNGYLNAQITDTTVSIDTVKSTADINIVIKEGALTRVEGITIFGNNVFSDSTLLAKIRLKPGDPYRRNRIQDGMMSIISLYADSGYLDANVKPDIKINTDQHLAMIDLNINENAQAHVNDIDIKGLQTTQKFVVRRELLFHKGEVISYSRLMQSQQKLYLTGLFESVFIKPVAVTGKPTEKNIEIEIKEKLPNEFNVAAGYGSVEKLRGKIELLSNNIYGTARQAGISVFANFIRRGVEVSFTEPWTLGLHLRTDINGLYEYLTEPGYNLSRVGARLTLGRSFRKNTNLTLTYRYEDARILKIKVSPAPDNIDPHVRSLKLAFTDDTRDNLFDPKRGTYFEWSNELAGAFLQGNNTFVRSIISGKWFYSLDPNTVLASAAEIGWMDYFSSAAGIPLNERFYAGGPNSIRGFSYQMVGPLDANGNPLGGRFKIVLNAIEVRRAVYKMVGVAAFVDIGNVWDGIRDFQVQSMRIGLGPGLRANTPIGIVRLDYGINPFPESGEEISHIYFSIGQAF